MGWKSKVVKILKDFEIDPIKDGGKFVVEKLNRKIEDEKSDREEFERNLKSKDVEELMLYVPDVYQESIYKIDYSKLWERGIKLLSFDIDDTIDDSIINKVEAKIPLVKVTMPKDAEELFEKLRNMGFIVTLLTNANSDVAKDVCEQLKTDGYIARANKPETMNFEVMQKKYGVKKEEMAHIGNSMRDDILGGNRFGITTCLVRRNGYVMKVVKGVSIRLGVPTKGQLIRERLLEHNLWRKHHLIESGDQYYQLGETQKYSANIKEVE